MASEDLGRVDPSELPKPRVVLNLQYQQDPQYLASPRRPAIDSVELPKRYEEAGSFVIDDLAIPRDVVVDVRVKPSNIPKTSNGGFLEENKYGRNVVMHFDPAYESVTDDLTRYAEIMLAHELNHAAREQVGARGSGTLLDSLIEEGLAVYYQEHFQDNFQEVPWGRALDPADLQKQWQRVQHKLFSHINHKKWKKLFEGNNRQHRPIYTGYRLGNAIIKAYMEKNPNTPMRNLVRMSSEEILQGSGFSYTHEKSWFPSVFRRI